MKSVPSSSSTLVELTCTQRCCFSESRTYKVANVVAIVIGLLILSAGLICSVLFGTGLGMLYTMVILGTSVAIGILLLTVGTSCLMCRSLASKTHRIDRKDDSKSYIANQHIDQIKKEISETTSKIDKVEKSLLKLVDEYNQGKVDHITLLAARDEAYKKLETISRKYSEARSDLNSLLDQLNKDSDSVCRSGGGG
ncbi:hypothetical protein [Chlamydia crocodili]|uniref:hypothetical protein n=1 Tax=Chlamydia crocodili TaxID=2766982 RepID=UPI003D3ECAD7